jgi:Predicted membrane protein
MTMALRTTLLLVVLAALVASGVAPYDRGVWWAEVMPVLIAAPILIATARRFPLTPLACGLIAFFALILILGGAYTYARVPIGFVVQDWFDLARNPYDRFRPFLPGRDAGHPRPGTAAADLAAASGKVAVLSRHAELPGHQRTLRAGRVGGSPSCGQVAQWSSSGMAGRPGTLRPTC